MREFILVLIAIMFVAPFSGCFENINSSSEANVVITKVDTEVIDGNFRITFHLKNVGEKYSGTVFMFMDIENQNGENRVKPLGEVVSPGLNSGDTATEIKSIKIWHDETKYIADIEVSCNLGERNIYNYEWEIK